ncbi:MAG: phosphate/phosphite/phosphonate ABC transporter substrate-binding protein [Oscillochloridaceae bacterium]|nr:phosphate/phosphite/phosphonate ABC transporter substrate-binding protein [Chloroflexaceae bacterium]MDW8392258.1 phosphate/phosphite/phosphonate ABC transporter substrate-binding protein [Oscillochloridaceae bacterium]
MARLMSTLIPIWLAALLAACGAAPVARVTPTPAPTIVADRAGWPERFRIGLFGGDDPNAVLRNAEPFRALLEARLGIPVEIQTGASYSAVIEAMRAGRVDAMEIGPFAYVLAVQEAGAEALAVAVYPQNEANPVYDPAAPSFYYSVYVTRKGSGINRLEDLRGASFAFVDPASTSGHLAPRAGLIKAGINPDTDMRTVFAGSHPTAVLSVWNGRTQAAATFEANLYRLQREGQVEFCGFPDQLSSVVRTAKEIRAVFESCPEGRLAILGFTDPIPNAPFAVNSRLPASFKAAMTSLLLEVKEHPDLVAGLRYWYDLPPPALNLPSVDSYYNSLREIARVLNLDLKELAR